VEKITKLSGGVCRSNPESRVSRASICHGRRRRRRQKLVAHTRVGGRRRDISLPSTLAFCGGGCIQKDQSFFSCIAEPSDFSRCANQQRSNSNSGLSCKLYIKIWYSFRKFNCCTASSKSLSLGQYFPRLNVIIHLLGHSQNG
jgi:hypothetical protein